MLSSITILSDSLAHVTSLSLSSPVLTSLRVGDRCFSQASTLVLDDLTALEQFEIGGECFSKVTALDLTGMIHFARVNS